MGRILIVLGIIFLVAGIAFQLGFRPPHWLGKLPGDIIIDKPGAKFYFPITTCILVSLILTVLFRLFNR